MAQSVNVTDTYDIAHAREVLADTISNISPAETPFYSMVGTKKVRGIHPEWTLDANDDPDTNNAWEDGYEYEFDPVDPTDRVGNYTQISQKAFKVSESAEEQDKVGQKSEVNRQRVKKGRELRIDMEIIALSDQASVGGSSSVARRAAGLAAWIETNRTMGSGGSAGGFNSSTGLVDSPVAGTKRAYTKTLFDEAIALQHGSGGNADIAMMSDYAKTKFSTFMSDTNVAAFRTNISGKRQGVIYAAADYYVSDFGGFTVMPNRQMTRAGRIDPKHASNIFLLDPDLIHFGIYRPFQEDNDVAKTGDYVPKVMKCEWTLIVDNEAGLANIADIYGMSASS